MLAIFFIAMACVTAAAYYMVLEDADPKACLAIMAANTLSSYVAYTTSWWCGVLVWVTAIVGLFVLVVLWMEYVPELERKWFWWRTQRRWGRERKKLETCR